MTDVVIDTNALISFVTDRNAAQQEVVAEILDAASRLKCSITCPQHVLTEFVFVMDRVYGVPKPAIAAMVTEFVALPGVTVRHELDLPNLFSLWPNTMADFGDAIVATVCTSIKGAAVLTFDERFQKALRRAAIALHPAATS